MSDNFGDTISENENKFKKTEYLTLKNGEYIIRILDSMETRKEAHYFQGRGWLECLGEACPICENNKRILYEHPEDYRDVQGWCPRRPRFFLNVLDRADGHVKVLSCGPTLIEDLKTMSKAIRNEKDERIDIRHYDWSLTVKGEGREKNTIPSHKFYGKETEPDTGGQELYDLNKCIIRVEPEEMLDVFNGASIKDIFAIRKAKKQAEAEEFPPTTDTVISEEAKQEISSAVDVLFQG